MHYPSMAKKNEDRSVPSRRRERGKPLTTALWAYVTEEEKTLIEWAAGLERRAVSSFISDVVLERVHELVRLYDTATSGAKEKPSTSELLAIINKPIHRKK